jgi:hypothetical protein
MPGEAGPVPGTRMTEDYVRSIGRLAYLWGWPLVNMRNRLSIIENLPGPGLLAGVVPGAPPGSSCVLHDYITPAERLVACPNQDVVYGIGIIDAQRGPAVVQVPDFGGRFWVYQTVDQRTDSFVRLGAMYQTKPGLYLLAPTSWDGAVPDGITGEFRFDTRIAVCIPRVFMDDTDSDRAATQPVIDQVMMYPLSEYTGRLRTTDWSAAPTFPAGGATSGDGLLLPGPRRARGAAGRVPLLALTFPANQLPPVRGFWSLTLYNEHHFFHPNELNRYSLGTKNAGLHHAADGSLTLTASAAPPHDDELRSNWLPAPDGPFSLYLRAYWPEPQILDGTWTPPPVARFH